MFIEPVTVVRQTDPEATLGSALMQISSTHDGVFVFDNGTFMGIVSPSQAVYKNRYPHLTKVRDGLLRAPHLTEQSSVFDAIRHMLAQRVYVLPVMEDGNVVAGVVRARTIIARLLDDQEFLSAIARRISPRKPITIRHDALVKEAHTRLKDEKVARLIVVDTEGKVTGIVSRADLAAAFMEPSSKQRFTGRKGTPSPVISYDEERIKRVEEPLSIYMSTNVFILPEATAADVILRKLLGQSFNCVVLTDDIRTPKGFLSLRDILGGISDLEEADGVSIVLTRADGITDEQEAEVTDLVRKFGEKIAKRFTFGHLNVEINEQKSKTGKALGYIVTFSVRGLAGYTVVSHGEHRQLGSATREALTKAERQLQKIA